MDAPTVKQGMHHPVGVLMAVGPGVPAGLRIRDCTNLDIAPTILGILGLQQPESMPGRALLAANA
jgi:bisphosphoglycerate-independent phosphoglycerate mutase (AlkP superfamily)